MLKKISPQVSVKTSSKLWKMPGPVWLWQLLIISLFFGVSHQAQAYNSEPNLEREARFHHIYQNYRKDTIAPETWEVVVGERRSEIYGIQRGDTLWDISRTFFNDAEYWPKIWALNSSITNPHLVQPGFQVRFFPGGLHQTPSLQIAEEGSGEQPTPVSVPSNILGEVEMPEPARARMKEREVIPATFPRYSYLPPAKVESDVIIETFIREVTPPRIAVPYIVTNSPPAQQGTFLGSENGSDSAANFDLVFVQIIGANPVGRSYVVFKEAGEVTGPTGGGQSEPARVGKYQVQGELRVREVVNQQQQIYRAEVVRALSPLTKGAFLAQSQIPEVELSSSGSSQAQVSGYVVGGQFIGRSKLFGLSSFIFLNVGSSHGLREGQLVPLYSNPLVRFSNTQTIQNQRQIGLAKVAYLDHGFATAVILESNEEVRVGDLTSRNALLLKESFGGMVLVDAPEGGAPVATGDNFASAGGFGDDAEFFDEEVSFDDFEDDFGFDSESDPFDDLDFLDF